MKKFAMIVMAALLSLALAVPMFADGLNENEKTLLSYAESEFETAEAGVYIKLPEAYVTKAENFLNMIDVSDAQMQQAEVAVGQIRNLIRTELHVADGVTTLNLADVTPEFYNQVLDAFRTMATALDATLTVVDDGTITDGVETGTVYVQSNTDPSAIVYVFGTSIAPGAPAASGNDVSDSVPMIVGLSCTAVVAVVAAAVWMTKRKAAGQNI